MFRKLMGACVGLAMMGVAGTAHFVLGVTLLVPLFFAPIAHPQAATVTFDGGGNATGITGLSVVSKAYDIIFARGAEGQG